MCTTPACFVLGRVAPCLRLSAIRVLNMKVQESGRPSGGKELRYTALAQT